MIRKILGFFLGVAILCPLALAVPTVKLPEPEIETLPNGLKLVWFLSEKLPVIDLALVAQSGYRHDPVGKSGTAELLAVSLERGAGGLGAQQFAREVEKLGAEKYVSVDEDSFSMGMHGLAGDGEKLLDLLSKLVLAPQFPDTEIAREHARILDRWNHLGDSGETLVSLAYSRMVSRNTEYGRGNFLSIAEFKKVGRGEVLGFYKTHFTPKNCVLMVVGRADKALFRQKIVNVFGNWQGEAPIKKAQLFADKRLPEPKKGQIVLVDRPSLTQAQVRLGFRAPLRTDPAYYALTVGNSLLGDYFNSRLNSVIRDKLGLTYSIGSSFSYSKALGRFTISSATRNDSVGKLLDQTLDILRELKRGEVSEEEVAVAKDYLVGSFPLGVSTLSSVAMRWLNGWLFDLGPGYLNEFVPRISEIQKPEVVNAVARAFDLDRLVITLAGNSAEIEKGLTEDQRKRVKKVKLGDLM